MSSSRGFAEWRDRQNAQSWNDYYLGFGCEPVDTQSTLSVDDFNNDVNQSVASCSSFDYRPADVTSPPTSTYSQSHAGDLCDPSLYASYDDPLPWISDYATSTDGCDQPGIDPRLLFHDENAQSSRIDVPTDQPLPDGTNLLDIPTEGALLPESYDFSVPSLPASTPEIRVEGAMQSWLQETYNVGDKSGSPLSSAQTVAMTMQKTHLAVPYRSKTDPDEDLRSDSSITTSCTGHSGHSHYSCPECPKSFHNKDDLRRHRRYHDPAKKHVCRRCGKSFVHPKDLRRHWKTHDATSSGIECPVDDCATMIGRLDNLKRHVMKQHNGFDFDSCPLFQVSNPLPRRSR